MNIKAQKENKICQYCQKNFTIEIGELNLYAKTQTEIPTTCHQCRLKQHLSFWVFGKFRKGTSDLSGDGLITILPENARYPIYSISEWYGDKWDAKDYGCDYNPSRSFFEQLKELQEKIPRPHQMGSSNTNCEWCDDVWSSKNCYLSRAMEECENLYYSYRNIKVKNSIDSIVSYTSEKCYEISDCSNCFKVFYSYHSKDCIDSYFLYDCRNCQDCFMSWNLRNKRFCIENVQYSKEEYENKLKEYDLGSYDNVQELKKRFHEIIQKEVVHRENFNLKVQNSFGNYLMSTKDCHNCNTVSDSEECFNCTRGLKNKSNIDADGCWHSELLGNCSCCVQAYSLKYSIWSSSRNSEYLDLCVECDSCFGCVGLKKQKYCILNKQYSEEEFYHLKNKIINDMKARGEYGKFLPYNMSLCPFNLSTAYFYFQETEEKEIKSLGGYWLTINEAHIEGLSTDDLPDHIKDVEDDIITKALICKETGWRFNVARNELAFYKENNIPLPRYHFDLRIKNQFKLFSVLNPYLYYCTFCKKEITAFYDVKWNYQKIACEDCYKQNIS
ncbi:MAG: hypothetical protein K9L98_02785 [Candidatus Pacebacteria bacterium]|nr:hypothetical protein [Candidatus Paceibacterota bacterium]MCF7862911.1 hypothetical protein [Candidatus Paceibacterota bacterium]